MVKYFCMIDFDQPFLKLFTSNVGNILYWTWGKKKKKSDLDFLLG